MPRAAKRFLLPVIGALALFGLSVAPAAAQSTPTQTPILRIETGMHTAQIPGLAADPKGRFVVTGSDDKTVRVWDETSGRLLQTLRPPIGPGDQGKIYAVAVSPDGNTIACGGATNAPGQTVCVYLFDRVSGQIRRRITGLPNVVLSLIYSPNGQYLAATLGRHGLTVFKADDGTPVAQDTQYADSCYGADFDASGRLVTASLDGYTRLYDAKFQRLARKPAPAGRFPWSAAFSPDGTRIAVGYFDSPHVSVVSGTDLSPLYAPDVAGVDNGNLKSVAWSQDGSLLYAAGQYARGNQFLIRRWTNGGRGAATDLTPGTHDTLAALCPLPNNALAWSGTDPLWGIWSGAKSRFRDTAPSVDFRGMDDAFRVSADGSVVQFRDAAHPASSVQFSLTRRLLQPATTPAMTLTPPLTQSASLDVTDWRNSSTPKLNGQPLTLSGHDVSRSLALAPDGGRFLLGTEQTVRCFDRTGHELWHVAAPDVAWAVNVTANGGTGIAAFADGTLHWYRMQDGQELLALFPHADRKRWVAWTPAGEFDCSTGGEDFVGWQLNEGLDQAADFFPAGRFRQAYYWPGVVQTALGPLAPIAESDPPRIETTKTISTPPPVTHLLPPVMQIVSPDDGTTVSSEQVTLRYTVRTPSGEPATTVRALIDGRPVGTQRDLRLVSRTPTQGETQQITVTIPHQDCTVSLVAENRYAPSEPAMVRLKWQNAVVRDPGAFVIKPKLYVLAIGISAYQDPSLRLEYGAKDAQDFARTLLGQKGKLYRDVQEKVLTDGTATKDDVLDGLQWVREQTTSKDVAMIFLAGHGTNDPSTGSYFFIPQNFDRDKLLRTGLPYTDIKTTVQAIAGKALFFIDTCHAGNVMGTGHARDLPDITPVVNELSSAENGVVVFSASTGNQVSWEDAAWGHGAFTKALIEGLTGGADYQHTGRITVNMLDLYLSERVKTLTHGEQTPTTTKPETVPDFPVAVLSPNSSPHGIISP